MKKSIKVDQKKKRGRPATGRDPMVSSRIPTVTVSAVDDWAQRNETTRSDAIRCLVELGLTVKTKAQPTERHRARASELAATAIDSLTVGTADADDQASRKRRLLKGPEEFRELRVDRLKAKGK
jgi:hypothetical protein